MKRITESDSKYDELEKMSLIDLLTNINLEDETVARSVNKKISQIERLVKVIVKQIKIGGRLFYLGAGTSGRMGIIDASSTHILKDQFLVTIII